MSTNRIGRIASGHRSAWLLAITLILSSSGCSQEAKVERHLKRGNAYVAEGEFDKARIEYLNVIQVDPENAEAFHRLGGMLFDQGVYSQAGQFLARAVQLDSSNSESRTDLAMLYAISGNLQKAREEALMALEADPTQEEALFLLADLANDQAAVTEQVVLISELKEQHGVRAHYLAAEAILALRQGDAAEADNLIQQAIQMDPELSAAYFVKGSLLMNRNDMDAAEAAMRTAAELASAGSIRSLRFVDFLSSRGKTNEAFAQLESILDRAPDFVPARLKLAETLFQRGDYQQARQELNRVLSRDRMNPQARLLHVQLLQAEEKPEEAVEVMDDLIADASSPSEMLYYRRALAQLANQNVQDAITDLEQAIQLQPLYADAIQLWARLKLGRGEAMEVAEPLQRILERLPDQRQIYWLLGDSYLATRQLDLAHDLYRQYETRFPEDPRGGYLNGLMMSVRGQEVEARKAFEKSLELDSSFYPSIQQLTRLDLQQEKFADAERRLRQYLEEQPENPGAHFNLAQVYLAQGNRSDAEQSLQRAIELDPRLDQAYMLLTGIYLEENRVNEAVQRLNRLLEEQPGNAKALMTLGSLHMQLKDYDAAIRNYERVIQVDQTFTPAFNNLAYLYTEFKPNLDRAVELARKARQQDPSNPSITDTLGWVLYRTGRFPEALALLEESATKLANIPEAQFHLGMARYSMGQEEAAEQALEKAVSGDETGPWKEEAQSRLAILRLAVDGGGSSAENTLTSYLNDHPNDVVALTKLGRMKENQGDYPSALNRYAKASTVNPNAPLPALGQARILVRQGKTEEALRIGRRFSDAAARDPSLASELGQVAYGAGDHIWAYSLLQQAVNRMPENTSAQFNFAQTAIASGRLDTARNALQKVTAANGASSSLVESAGRQLELIQVIESSSTGAGNLTRAELESAGLLGRFLQARLSAAEGRTQQSVDELEAISRKYPGFTPATRLLAMLYMNPLNQPAKAEEYARKARESLPDDPVLTKIIGQVALSRGDAAYAVQMLASAADQLAGDGRLLFDLGRAQMQLKQFDPASKSLNAALSSGDLSAEQQATARQLISEIEAQR